MSTTRRKFIQYSALVAAGAAYGPGFWKCFAQESRQASRPASNPSNKSALDEGLACAAATGQLCVVLRLPDAPEERQKIGEAWIGYLFDCDNNGKYIGGSKELPDFELHALFAETVFVFLTKKEAADARLAMSDGESFCWIDANRKCVGRANAATAEICNRDLFVKSIGTLLHGENNDLLQKRADESYAQMTPEARGAIVKHIEWEYERLDINRKTLWLRDNVGRRSELLWRFDGQASGSVHWTGELLEDDLPSSWVRLVNSKLERKDDVFFAEIGLRRASYFINLIRVTKSNNKKFMIYAILEHAFLEADKSRRAGCLPFGVRLGTKHGQSNGCGGIDGDENVPGSACGMGESGPVSRKFINYLSK
ncbi:MAG: hypothetical protein HY286_17010 [Planctomycetes bacterium]|nr:hypothetical protein [Planctomycetota bacterium]